MPNQMARLLAEFLKEVMMAYQKQRIELNAHSITLFAVKKAYPNLAQQLDDYLENARSAAVPQEEGRARFEAILEKFLQPSPEPLSELEVSEALEALKRGLTN
jgi:hypothetical protein